MSFPEVKLDRMKLIESEYENKEGYVYSAVKLIEASKDLPVFEIPLASIDLSILPFSLRNLSEFIFQMQRVKDTDLQYPIILDDMGVVADGYHRIAKAILNGQTTIKAVRLQEMPDADRKVNLNE